jgi:hypothetical protein
VRVVNPGSAPWLGDLLARAVDVISVIPAARVPGKECGDSARLDFRRLIVRITDELEGVEVLTADDLRALMEPDREAVR